MRVGPRRIRKGLGVAVLASTAVAVACGFNVRASSAADADLFGFQAAVNPPPMGLTQSAGGYTLSGGTCALGSVPSPASTDLPGYLDASSGRTGACTLGPSDGTLMVVNCDTGSITAHWQLGEPDGDTVGFVADGVMVGGVAVLEGAPVSLLGTGYSDPIGTANPGTGTGVAIFLPSGTEACPASSFIGHVVATVVGVQ